MRWTRLLAEFASGVIAVVLLAATAAPQGGGVIGVGPHVPATDGVSPLGRTPAPPAAVPPILRAVTHP